jgi:hypothetical protein
MDMDVSGLSRCTSVCSWISIHVIVGEVDIHRALLSWILIYPEILFSVVGVLRGSKVVYNLPSKAAFHASHWPRHITPHFSGGSGYQDIQLEFNSL